MGTRNLTCVVSGGDFKVAQYGQWDGYPSGSGRTVLDFLRDVDLATFRQKVNAARFVTEEERTAAYKPFTSGGGMMDMNQADAFKASPIGHWSRDTGADILQTVMDMPEGIPLVDSRSFAKDGLMCEWAYIVDLDSDKLEVYSGFHVGPAPEGERFAVYNRTDVFIPKYEGDKDYGPIRLLHTFDLNALPDDDTFIKVLVPSEDEEEEDAEEVAAS